MVAPSRHSTLLARGLGALLALAPEPPVAAAEEAAAPGAERAVLPASATAPTPAAAPDPQPLPSAAPAPDPVALATAVRKEPYQTVVLGLRPSLATAQDTKRRQVGVVDSIVATDIQKLPDASVNDALGRVAGVQVARDRGEGGQVAIRGLTQMETTFNGREIFTAGAGRALDFQDLPAELVARIDVHKTSSAERLEGGLGGLVDLRSWRPFDFKGGHVAGSARLIHGDLVEDARPQLSLLASDRWRLPGGRHVGALVSGIYQERPFREDQKGTGTPYLRRDPNLFGGAPTLVPNGTSETASAGVRRRVGGLLVLQALPSDSTEVYAEASIADFRTRQISQQLNVTTAAASVEPGSATRSPGSDDLRSITWTGAPLSVLSFARDTADRSHLVAAGGSWTGERLTLRGDVSHTYSTNRLDFSGLILGGTAARFHQDLSPRIPHTFVLETDLRDPRTFPSAGVAYRTWKYAGELTAARLDADVRTPAGPLRLVSGGVRAARRRAGTDGLVFGDVGSSRGASAVPGLLGVNPYAPFFPGSTSVGPYLAGDPGVLRDNAGLRAALGIATPVPTVAGPTSVWSVREDTLAGYLLATFGADRLEGNAGVRVVRTIEAVSGRQAAQGVVSPLDATSAYTDWLPSVNARVSVGHGLFLRGAASRTLTRPQFSDLSPSLLLIPNTIDPSLNQGSAGNPTLRPLRSNNLDLALEGYFGPATSAYVTGFLKRVDGFVAKASAPETYDGVTYQVTRPHNSDRGDIRGLEAGYQQFLTFLPGPLRGLGLQTNFTLVTSETRDPVLGDHFPLQGLSKRAANVVGMYELGGVSARLAYSWRDRFLSGATPVANVGALPVYTEGYGWLDGSIGYRAGKGAVSLEGTNLLRTIRRSYYGTRAHPQAAYLNDVQVSLSFTFRS